MALFHELKDTLDDSPEGLLDLVVTDESVRDLCLRLCDVAGILKKAERRRPQLFASPTNSSFRSAWRDYEARYQALLGKVPLQILMIGLDDSPDKVATSKSLRDTTATPKLNEKWKTADIHAHLQSIYLDEAIVFAYLNTDDEERWVDREEFVENIKEGIQAWEDLKQNAGFELRGIFRRRALVPFVLVPPGVAAKHGSNETLSMLKNLRQAHDAFVYGAPFAALALMRSIMEAVLRDHYGVEGNDLKARIDLEVRINNAPRLPRGVSKFALHRLRKWSNAVLHLDPENRRDVLPTDEAQLEQEIVLMLGMLCALIEGAEQQR